MTWWFDEQHIVLVTPGKLYRMRNGKLAFVERLHKIPWAYNGEPKEHPIWLGFLVDDGTRYSWEFWGSVSPRHYRHIPHMGFVAVQDDLDLVDEVRQ